MGRSNFLLVVLSLHFLVKFSSVCRYLKISLSKYKAKQKNCAMKFRFLIHTLGLLYFTHSYGGGGQLLRGNDLQLIELRFISVIIFKISQLEKWGGDLESAKTLKEKLVKELNQVAKIITQREAGIDKTKTEIRDSHIKAGGYFVLFFLLFEFLVKNCFY